MHNNCKIYHFCSRGSEKSQSVHKSKQSVRTDKIDKISKNGSKSKRRSTIKSDQVLSSKNNTGEVLERYDVDMKREKALTILENPKSGNPFEETEEANSVNMYYPVEGGQNGSNSHSLKGSIKAKRDKLKSSLPIINHNRSNSQTSNNGEADNSGTFKLSKEKREILNKSRTKQNEFTASRRKMGSYDLNANKTMDRELKKQKIEGDNKDTIMTVNDAAYSSHRLEEMKVCFKV